MSNTESSEYLTRPADVELVEGQLNPLFMRALLRGDASEADLSLTWVSIHGRHGRLRSDRSTRLYYILDGQGTVTIEDSTFPVRAGDLAVVPTGAAYEYEGTMSLLIVNQPAFQEGDDIRLE